MGVGASQNCSHGDVGACTSDAHAYFRHPPTKWAGWGCSLAWMGKALGSSLEKEAWADLLFTTGDVLLTRLWPDWASPYMPHAVPGLGISIVRYNVGGAGRVEDQSGEARSSKSRGWHVEIEGFQPLPFGEFDWSRDEGQQRFLKLAVERGVDQVDLFSNAPMWWMSHTASSFGGTLSQPDAFAAYLAEVATYMRSTRGIPVRSVSPFNEPSAPWWRYPHDQEGCRMPVAAQADLIARLRDHLDRNGLGDVIVATSDENQPDTAYLTWEAFRQACITNYIGRINVHSYKGNQPWREENHPGCRGMLRCSAEQDGVPIWVTEHGNGDKYGTDLAWTILEDIQYFRPNAWCYWQPVEHKCSWGFIEADFSPSAGARALNLPNPKYYVFAHFTRFLRPGFHILQCTDPCILVGFSPDDHIIVCIIVNMSTCSKKLTTHLYGFATSGNSARAVLTLPEERVLWVERQASLDQQRKSLNVSMEVPAKGICSIEVEDIWPMPPCDREQVPTPGSGSSRGVTARQVLDITKHAAWGAANERSYGATDAQATREWMLWEHACGCAAVALAPAPRKRQRLGSGHSNHVDDATATFKVLLEMLCSAAWGAANERAFGNQNQEARASWERFKSLQQRLGAMPGCVSECFEDLTWMVFNTCWAIANERWFGENNDDCKAAKTRAEKHLGRIGGSTVILQASA